MIKQKTLKALSEKNRKRCLIPLTTLFMITGWDACNDKTIFRNKTTQRKTERFGLSIFNLRKMMKNLRDG